MWQSKNFDYFEKVPFFSNLAKIWPFSANLKKNMSFWKNDHFREICLLLRNSGNSQNVPKCSRIRNDTHFLLLLNTIIWTEIAFQFLTFGHLAEMRQFSNVFRFTSIYVSQIWENQTKLCFWQTLQMFEKFENLKLKVTTKS